MPRARRRDTIRLKDPSQVPLHRQGQPEARRRPGHRHRQGAVRHRHAAAGHAVRGGRAAAGLRRQGGELRRGRGAEGARRASRSSRSSRAPAPPQFKPLGGVAVVASNTWAAIQGRKALKIDWDDGPNGSYDSTAFKAELEESARKPGKVVRNDGDVDAALAERGEAARGRVLHAPPRARADGAAGRDGAHRQRQGEVWALRAVARRPRATWWPSGSASRADNVTVQRDAARRRLRPQVQARLRASRRRCSRRRWTASRSRSTWTREDDLHHDYFHTVSVEHLEAGLDAQGKPVAWLHRSVAPTIFSTFVAGAKNEAPLELGMGVINVPFAIPNVRIENPEADGAHAHRLVPLGLEHPARVRGAVVRRRAGRGGGARSEGLPAGGHRAGPPGQPARRWATRGTTASRPSGTRWTPAGCGAWWRPSRARRAGAASCPRAAGSASPRTTAS